MLLFKVLTLSVFSKNTPFQFLNVYLPAVARWPRLSFFYLDFSNPYLPMKSPRIEPHIAPK